MSLNTVSRFITPLLMIRFDYTLLSSDISDDQTFISKSPPLYGQNIADTV